MYLYNKNILEYAQILVTSGRFMIFYNEGHSSTYDIAPNDLFEIISLWRHEERAETLKQTKLVEMMAERQVVNLRLLGKE